MDIILIDSLNLSFVEYIIYNIRYKANSVVASEDSCSTAKEGKTQPNETFKAAMKRGVGEGNKIK